MSINRQPLKLYDLATFQVVINASFPNTKDNMAASSKIKLMPCTEKVLTDICHVRDQCRCQLSLFNLKSPQSVLLYYMQNLVESCVFYTEQLKQPDKEEDKKTKIRQKLQFCEQKIRNFLPTIDIEPVINEIFQLFEIDQDFLLLILDRVTEFTVLNNFLMMGSFYGLKSIIDMAVLKGADDFDSAIKAACLKKDEEMIKYLKELDGSVDLSIFTKTSQYRNYYFVIHAESYSSCYKQFLAGEKLKDILEDNYPFEESGLCDWVEDLDVPIARWTKFNLFRNIAVMNAFDVGGFVHFRHNQTQFLSS